MAGQQHNDPRTDLGAGGPRTGEHHGRRTGRPPVRARLSGFAQWWRRAASHSGHERHSVLLIGKSVLAAALAWVVAHDLMGARSPAFAPFSAVLVMQPTVYQSVVQSLRYAGAVVVGVAVQAALGLAAGPGLVAFVLVALVALVVGQWARLGSQGTQVPTAAFFAFATYTAATDDGDRLAQLAQIVLLVLIGCSIGTLVHSVVVPPMRHRSAEFGISTLARTLAELLADIAPVLREGEPGGDSTGRLRRRADMTDVLITRARASMRTAQDSVHFNPRRHLRGHRTHTSFQGYATVLEALVRTLYQVASLTRSLDQWYEQGEDRHEDLPFLRSYADFLDSLVEFAHVLVALDEERLPSQAKELNRLSEEAEHLRRALAEEAVRRELPLADPSRPYGVLVVEATRLREECRHCCDALRHWARE
ncbi:FUSC family protein [Streptomyces sp. NPDC054863]